MTLPADEPYSAEFRNFVAQWYVLSLFLMCASISCLLYSSKVNEILYLNTIVLALSASKMQVFAPRISNSEKFLESWSQFFRHYKVLTLHMNSQSFVPPL